MATLKEEIKETIGGNLIDTQIELVESLINLYSLRFSRWLQEKDVRNLDTRNTHLWEMYKKENDL